MEKLTYQSTYVAFLDILGYRQLVYKNDHQTLSKIHSYSIPQTAGYNSQRLIKEGGRTVVLGDNEYVDVKSLMLSDSIINWTKDDSSRSFLDAIYKTMSLIVESIFNYIPMRGAISSGTISFTSQSLETGINQVSLFGKPIVTAYDIQSNANWIGCTVDKESIELYKSKNIGSGNQTSIENMIDRRVLVEYEIPLKKGKIEKEYAINWMLHHKWRNYVTQDKRQYSITDLIRGAFSGLNKEYDNWDVENKIRNTLTFTSNCSNDDLDYKFWPFAVEINDRS